MDGSRITVLKFGSSVLRTVGDLPSVVREIRRWLDGASRVVAVVSAIGNTTDALFHRGPVVAFDNSAIGSWAIHN
jgi:aspartokinase